MSSADVLEDPGPAIRLLSEPARPRHDWIDVARGLTIVLVVLFHAARGMFSSDLVPPGSILHALDFFVYTFHMPAFFFLSGLLLRRALDRPPGIFWPGRIRALLLPYVLWMTIQIGILALTSSVSNQGAFHPSIANYLWDPIAPFWFLYSLFCINAALYLVRRLPASAMVVLAVLLYGLSRAAYDVAPELVFLTMRGLLFVTIGMAMHSWVHSRLPPGVVLPLAAGLFAGVCLVSYPSLLRHESPELVLSAGLMGTMGIVLLSQFLADTRLSALLGPLRFLGQISLTLLVVHILGTAGARIVLIRLLHVQDVWVHLAVDTAAGLALGVAVQWVASWTRSTGWLGLPDIPVRLHIPLRGHS